MRNKRYRQSTVKTYKEAVVVFLRFLGGNAIVDIDNQDLETFNKAYILARAYSSSYQNQVVNGIKLFFLNRKNYSVTTAVRLQSRLLSGLSAYRSRTYAASPLLAKFVLSDIFPHQ